jgi:hypothetical protein
MVGQSGGQPPLRRAASHGDQQISRPENLPGLGNCRTMKNKFILVNLSGRGDKDVAQVAAKVKLEMPK